MHHPGRARAQSWLFVLMSASLLAGSGLRAQDDANAGGQQPPKPEQTHASAVEDPFLNRTEPHFAFGRKGKKWAEQMKSWRVVDHGQRSKETLQRIDEEIAKESEKPEDQRTPGRIIQLERARGVENNESKALRMLFEKAGDRSERVVVSVEELGNGTKFASVLPKDAVSKWGNFKLLLEKDFSTKAQQSKGCGYARLEFLATPPNEEQRVYLLIDTYLVQSKDGSRMHRIYYTHRMPAARYSEEARKEAYELASLFKVM